MKASGARMRLLLSSTRPISYFKTSTFFVFLALVLATYRAEALAAATSMPVLYPSFAASWATTWIAIEAGYFSAEGLDVELVRVGGSTRMVAAMLGGSAPVIQAGAPAAIAAGRAGGGVIIIAARSSINWKRTLQVTRRAGSSPDLSGHLYG